MIRNELMANYYDNGLFIKMSSEIKEMFIKLQDALKCRETQLLRQIEVLSQHCQLTEAYDKYTKQISLVFDNSNDLFQSISSLGKINFSGLHCTSEVFRIEDYEKFEIDHDSFNKYLENSKHSDKLNGSLLKVKKVKENECNHHKQDIKETCGTDTVTKKNSLLECIGKDDPKLCQHSTAINEIHNDIEDMLNMNSECTTINGNDFIDDKIRKISLQQPVPIQHWMNDIILETELEPTSNIILEHSRIE